MAEDEARKALLSRYLEQEEELTGLTMDKKADSFAGRWTSPDHILRQRSSNIVRGIMIHDGF